MEEKPFYRLISTVYASPYGDRATTYGIEVVAHGQVAEFPDIDLSEKAVLRLIARLQGTECSFHQLADIVVDYVAELATL